MEDKRPVNLDLTTIKFPCTAIASILHRVSGVILFLLIPLLLLALADSLQSARHFEMLARTLGSLPGKVTVLLIMTALSYHLLAGIRHMMMDKGLAESLRAAKITATLVMVLTGVVVVMLGVRLWS